MTLNLQVARIPLAHSNRLLIRALEGCQTNFRILINISSHFIRKMTESQMFSENSFNQGLNLNKAK